MLSCVPLFTRLPFVRFYKPVVGEPVVCTPDSHGFRHVVVSVISAAHALNHLICGGLSCLHRCRRFCDSRRFYVKNNRLQTLDRRKHALKIRHEEKSTNPTFEFGYLGTSFFLTVRSFS